MRKLRIVLGLIILVLSLALLAWGILPAERERHTLHVAPSEMTVPTPSSFLPGVPAVAALSPVAFAGG